MACGAYFLQKSGGSIPTHFYHCAHALCRQIRIPQQNISHRARTSRDAWLSHELGSNVRNGAPESGHLRLWKRAGVHRSTLSCGRNVKTTVTRPPALFAGALTRRHSMLCRVAIRSKQSQNNVYVKHSHSVERGNRPPTYDSWCIPRGLDDRRGSNCIS